MNYEIKLAWKYFRARRKSLARFTSFVAIAGIACGVASLIVAQAITRGFRDEVQEKILSNTAHITVFQKNSEEIGNWRIIKKELEKIENVTEVSPTTYESAIITGEKITSYAVVRAVQGSKTKDQRPKIEDRINSTAHISENPNQGEKKRENSDSKYINASIGAELAEKAELKKGDEAKIILPSSGGSEILPKTINVRVADIFRTGVYDYDSMWVYISFEDLAYATDKVDFPPTVLSITVKDIYAADKTARKIQAILPDDFKVIDWQQANLPLFTALSFERKISAAIISLVIFIAVLNITTTLSLLVGERRLDIAILRTCGARAKSLIFIFLFEGLFLGLIGTFLGVITGFGACFAGNYFKLINLPPAIYALSYIPLNTSITDIILITVIALFLTLAATIYPAWRAAKIKPLENLQNQ